MDIMCIVEFLNKNQGVLSFLVFLLFAVYILAGNIKRVNKFIPCMNMIFAICAFIFSVLSLCWSFPRTNLEFDYIGFILGALSFLVAILAIMFGYNIFNFQGEINRGIDKKLEKVKEECLIETYSNSIIESDSMMKYYLENKKWNEILILKKINMLRELNLSKISCSHSIKTDGVLQLTKSIIENSDTFDDGTYNNYVLYMDVFKRFCKGADNALNLYNEYMEKKKKRIHNTEIVPNEIP